MTIDQFLAKYQNKSWDFDGMYGNQCFDLFQFYNRDVVGAPFVTGASAKDIWNTYPKAFYEQIANGPTNFPVRGDVVIWGDKYGPYGHVAICTEGDVNKFTCLSQNDPAGVPSNAPPVPGMAPTGMPNGTPEAELIINALSNRLKSDSKIKEAQVMSAHAIANI